MNVYMATYKKLYRVGDQWIDNKSSNHTFYIFAEDESQAEDYLKSALNKVNEYAAVNTKYVYEAAPKMIHTLAVSNDQHLGTSITGIWA